MHFFSVIIQPFILIALGFLLSRLRMFPRSLWEGVEKLVYYVLFPPLLFNSVARAELTVPALWDQWRPAWCSPGLCQNSLRPIG